MYTKSDMMKFQLPPSLKSYLSVSLSLFAVLCLLTGTAEAQLLVTGRVTDSMGEGLPFAAVYKKSTTQGTTTNADGYYTLKLSPGKHTVVFRYVGYKTEEFEIDLLQDVQRDMVLEPDVVQLQAIEVVANGEDPAYAVIRQAIAKRKEHLNEVNAYDCDVYIKGLQRLDKAPDAILGINIEIDTGIAYLSESVSKFSYQRPGKTKETVISSKVSGDNAAFSYNQATGMILSFYENTVDIVGLSERPFISPIAAGAMLFYEYKLEGFIEKDGLLINKIKVRPRRSSDPAFTGHIYIIEDTWRIHSLNLLLTKENNINFIDSLTIEQQYAPVDEGPWMLFNQKFNFKLNAFGFKGQGYYVGVHSNYALDPIHPKGYFNSTILKVEEESNKRDSSYWAVSRPIPLTGIEQNDYQVKDSIRIIKESKPYLDSIDAVNNKVKPLEVFVTGVTFRNSFEKRSLSVSPLLNSVQFNTVEGVVISPEFSLRRSFDDNRFYEISASPRYGISSEQFYPSVSAIYSYNPKRYSYAAISMGHTVQQFNPDNPIRPYINSFMTLFSGENFMKLYEKTFVRLRHRGELAPGLRLDVIAQFEDRSPLFNTNDFSFASEENTDFTPNSPVNVERGDVTMPAHQAADFQLSLRWIPFQKYIDRPDERFSLYPEWPRIILTYRQGVSGIFGSDVDYSTIDLKISHDLSFGLGGYAEWQVRGGTFLSANEVFLPDFFHFNGNRTPFGKFNLNSYELLDYYQFATQDAYFKANYSHHFNGFIFNKLPLIRKLDLQAVGTVHYLYTDVLGHYVELGVGIEHIFKVLRVDFYTGFREGNNTDTGLRFGLGF